MKFGRGWSIWLVAVLTLACWLGACLPALAHDLGLTSVTVSPEAIGTRVQVRTPLSRLVRLIPEMRGRIATSGAIGPDGVLLDRAVRSRLHLQLADHPFAPTQAAIEVDGRNDMLVWTATTHQAGTGWVLEAPFAPEQAGSRTLLVVAGPGGSATQQLLEAGDGARGNTPLAVAAHYVSLGWQHILSGPDHLLFLAGLLLLSGTLKALLRTVAAFTVAHSITLCLAAMGLLVLPGRVIEPLIALSIVLLAVESLQRVGGRGDSHPGQTGSVVKPGVIAKGCGHKCLFQTVHLDSGSSARAPLYAFIFGLVHGCGFAGGLSLAGLGGNALATALIAFNGGIELGQLAFVLPLAPLLWWAARTRPRLSHHFTRFASMGIGLAGAQWVVTRIVIS